MSKIDMKYLKFLSKCYTLYVVGRLVTQWAAVSTYLSPTSDPPHLYCILPCSPTAYPIRASHGYSPISASSPPTIRTANK